MAENNKVVIEITGDSTDLVKSLDQAVNSMNKTAKVAANAGGEAGKGIATGAKTGAQSAINEFRTMANLSKGSFASMGESFLSAAVNPITLGAAAIGAAIYGAFSLAKIGEENNKIASNFALIAGNAGLNARELKEELSAAAEGYADLEDILPVAGEAIIRLGQNSKQLGDVFELSRNIAVRTGGDVKNVFDQVSTGIARQNEKLLINNGIHVDTTKVLDAYAAANKTIVGDLTDSAKQHAILNAVLIEGKKNYKDTGAEVAPMAGGIKKLELAMDDLKDAFAAVANSKLGAAFAAIASATAAAVSGMAQAAGSATAGLSAQDIKILEVTESIKRMEDALKNLPAAYASPTAVENYTNAIAKQRAELALLKSDRSEIESQGIGTPDKEGINKEETAEQKKAKLERIAEIEAQQRELNLKSEAEHQFALSQLKNEGGTFEEKAAAKQALQQEYANAEYNSQLEKNSKIKSVEEKAAADNLALAKKDANEKKNIDLADIDRSKAKADAKRKIEENLFAASLNFAEGNAEATKLINVAQAIRNTYLGATLALASYPPPFNVIAAASTVALGISQVAKITAAKDGGIVAGGAGGRVDDQPFMLAKGEIVAPAKSFDQVVDGAAREKGFVKGDENRETNDLLRQLLSKIGGGGITVQAGVLVADDNGINQLAEKLRDAVRYRDASLA